MFDFLENHDWMTLCISYGFLGDIEFSRVPVSFESSSTFVLFIAIISSILQRLCISPGVQQFQSFRSVTGSEELASKAIRIGIRIKEPINMLTRPVLMNFHLSVSVVDRPSAVETFLFELHDIDG